MRISTRLALRLASLLAATSLSPADAAQVIEARDGASVTARIALKEATRLKVEGTPISDVVGNIYSSTCGAAPSVAGPSAPQAPVNPAGEILLECDKDKGQVYVRPAPQQGAKPISLFVSTASATYTLVLQPVDMPADTIVIRDRSARAGTPDTPPAKSSGHVRALKAMLLAMATERPWTDMRVEEVGQPVALWAEARFTLLRAYEGRGMVGEKYLLTNVSAAPMVLAEPEFYRDGVLGVSIEHLNVRPGESTTVYVIRSGGQR